MSRLEDFIRSYRGPSFRIGKALRMRGAGYVTLYVNLDGFSADERRAIEIIAALSEDDCAVLGRVLDAAWYEQNNRDIKMLEAKAKDAAK